MWILCFLNFKVNSEGSGSGNCGTGLTVCDCVHKPDINHIMQQRRAISKSVSRTCFTLPLFYLTVVRFTSNDNGYHTDAHYRAFWHQASHLAGWVRCHRRCPLQLFTNPIHNRMNVAAGPELAAAVTNAGGLGVIGGVGYTPKILRQQVRRTSFPRDQEFPFFFPFLHLRAFVFVGGHLNFARMD